MDYRIRIPSATQLSFSIVTEYEPVEEGRKNIAGIDEAKSTTSPS